MTGVRVAMPAIADMQARTALPRKSGEIVFHNEWERRAFALAVKLTEEGLFEWREFQLRLTQAIADAERGDPQNPSRGYYESWLLALEAMLDEKRILTESRQ